MTNQEAIAWIKSIKDKYIHGGDDDFDEKRKKSLDMAIKALEQQPCEDKQDCEHCIHTYGTLGCCDMVNNEWIYDCDFGREQYRKEHGKPCEDCISRKDTIEWLKKVTVTEGIEFKTGFEQILYDIEQLPSVNPDGENFTDEEKRIFLASVAREMRVCEQIDSEKTKVRLVPIVQRVKEKVLRSSLWKEVEE